MNRDDWNTRYAGADLVWGSAPNRFVAAELDEPGARTRPRPRLRRRSERRLARRAGLAGDRDRLLRCGDRSGSSSGCRARRRDLARSRRRAGGPDRGGCLRPRAARLPPASHRPSGPLSYGVRLRRCDRGDVFLLVGHDLRNHAEGHGGPQDPSVLWTVTEISDALSGLGFTVERAEEVLRDVDGAPRPAIDTIVRARAARPSAERERSRWRSVAVRRKPLAAPSRASSDARR